MHLGRNGVDVRNRAIIWSGAFCVVLAGPVFGQTPHEVQSQTPDRSAFIELLERAVGANDRAYVAAQLQYPLTVLIGGFRVPFTTPAAVLERYDDIFTAELKGGLEQQVTIAAVDGGHRITAMAVPRSEPDNPASTGTPAPIAREPRRIAVRAGPRPTQFAGSLAAGGTDTYVFFVPKGQLVQVRVDRGGGEAVLDMVHATLGIRISRIPRRPRLPLRVEHRRVATTGSPCVTWANLMRRPCLTCCR